MTSEQIAIFLTLFVALMAPILDFKFKKVLIKMLSKPTFGDPFAASKRVLFNSNNVSCWIAYQEF